MRLLLVSYFYSFNDSTGALRPRAMAKYLPKDGIEVYALTYFPQREDIAFRERVIGLRNITRDTVSRPVYYAWRIWTRALRALGLYRGDLDCWRDVALRQAEAIIGYAQPDAILATYPTVEALEIGLALSRKFGLPLISDFRDGLLFEPIETGALAQRATRKRYTALEAEVVASSRLVLTVSEPISQYFRERYGHANVKTLHNGFDLDDIQPNLDVELPAGVVNIVHTGRLSMSSPGMRIDALAAALNLLIARAPELAQKFRLHFIGQLTAAEKTLFAPPATQGVIKIWGPQSRRDAMGLQRKADILLLVTEPDKASIATGKLFEYLFAHKPILALTRGTEAERLIRQTGAGWVVAPDDPERIAAAIEDCVRGTNRSLLHRDEQLVAKFSREAQMKDLAVFLKEALPAGARPGRG